MKTSAPVQSLCGAELRAAARILEHRVDRADQAGVDEVIISKALALSLAKWLREDAMVGKGIE